MNKTKRFEKAKWLAMLLCIALMAPSATEAQETNPLQEFIDSVTLANTVTAPDGTKKVKKLAKGAVPTLDLSKSPYSSYKNLTYTLDVTTSIKVVNGIIGAADGFLGDRSGNAVAPLIRVKNGMTLYIDETAGASASNLTTAKCPATVELYECSTLSQGGDITAPDNGTGVAIYLDSDCCTLIDEGGDINGTIATNGPATSEDILLYCGNITVKPGTQALLPIFMKNNLSINAFQFNITLPNGVSVPNSSEVISTDRSSKLDFFLDNNITGYNNTIGLVAFTIYPEKRFISAGNGVIAYLPLLIDDNMRTGVFECKMFDIEYVPIQNDGIGHFVSSTTSTITVINDGTVQPGIAINETNFPDANFRSYLLSQDYGMDAWLTYSEIDAIKTINVSSNSISDLTGIAYFTELDTLVCSNNSLTALDVSALTKLRYLDCGNNLLTALNVTKNTALTYLNCGRIIKTEPGLDITLSSNLNKIQTLDLSNNTALETLGCSDNLLTELDVSGLSNLKVLDCSKNDIYSLDVSSNNKIESVNCSGNINMGNYGLSMNTNLTALFCDEIGLTESKDFSSLTNLRYFSCGGNALMMIVVPQYLGVSLWSKVDQTVNTGLYSLGGNRYALKVPDGFDLSHINSININDGADVQRTDWDNGGIKPFELVAGNLIFSTTETPQKISYSYNFSPIDPLVSVIGFRIAIDVTVNFSGIFDSSNAYLCMDDIEANRGSRIDFPLFFSGFWHSTPKTIQFDLILPDGVSIAENANGEYMINTTEEAGSVLSVNKLTNANGYQILFDIKGRGSAFEKIEALNVTLDIDNTVDEGQYIILMKNIIHKFYVSTNPPSWRYSLCADNTCTLTINDFLLGDVNDDGYVTLADAICEISWLLEQNPPVFVEAVADYNEDNVISASDAIAIIQYVVTANTNVINPDVPDEDVAKLLEEMGLLRPVSNGFDLQLGDLRGYTAFTVDITLDDDATLLSASLGTHSVATHSLGNGRYRIVAWSMDMASIGAGAILHCETIGGKTSAVTLDNIRIVDMNTREHAAPAVECTPTGIREVETGVAPAVRYRIDGTRASGSQRGIYIERGKKITIK